VTNKIENTVYSFEAVTQDNITNIFIDPILWEVVLNDNKQIILRARS